MNIVVIRFSSLGDVALTSPVISSILKNNPDVCIWYVSNPNYNDLFQKNDQFHFISADLYGKHKGVLGLKKLVTEITNEIKIDAVVDLHDVLRTKIMKLFFKLKGINTITFNKGRKEKKELISGKIPFKALPHITDRYSEAFKTLVKNHTINTEPTLTELNTSPLHIDENTVTIGIAPFAAHQSKEWGLVKIEQLINNLSNFDILLFGGESNLKELEILEGKYKNCMSVAGKFNLGNELKIISKLSLMICMDSANMHLAHLTGIPIVSIWGPTHHYLGYGPKNDLNHIVEVPKEILPCRPCSIYGKLQSKSQRKCARMSMEKIGVQKVLDKINLIIET